MVLGGPAEKVMVAGVQIYVAGKSPAGIIVTYREGPRTLLHGMTARTLPPNERLKAEADKGANSSTARKIPTAKRGRVVIFPLYTRGNGRWFLPP